MNTKSFLTPTKKYKTLISAIHSIYRLVNSTFELKELVCRLARLICQIFNARSCYIVILDPSKQYSTIKCMVADKKKHVIDRKVKIMARLERKIIKSFATIRRNNMLALPLVSEDIMGLMIVKRGKNDAAFDRCEQEILTTVLEQAMTGIKNLQLYEEQQKIIFGSIKSLVTILDARIPREETHSPYFIRLVKAIAHQMQLDEKQIECIQYASLLHDAGKADIPIEILSKTTKLTPKEFKIIKGIPLKSAQILRPIQSLRPVISIIMHHHEKYNGTGYPSRLKKGQIPIGARIMAVADAFEAMVYGRPYKERICIDLAVKEIKKKSGTQFDPKVVEAFLRIIKKMSKKYLQLSK
ncbi:MAG: HD domain-containing phosphohydrolase [Candidatus Omnitrophota bacterium]|jgi:response regulator RpfG family c-di-GMP phosphodiesterase